MDADAYLRKQGWKGTGHSLDGQGRGIRKPLLIAHKQDQLGLGKKKAAHSVDDQWWMRAFDQSLQNIGTGKESTLNQIRTKGINRGGLYGFFVKGEGLVGTISSAEESSAVETSISSAAPSDASTPPTSASESESALKSSDSDDSVSDAPTMSKKKNTKRKRGNEDDAASRKKAKQDGAADVSQSNGPLTVTTFLGTHDAEQITKINAVMRQLRRQARATANTEAQKKTNQQADDSGKPNKRIESKIERETLKRELRRDLFKDLVAAAMVKGNLPNPEGWTKDNAIQKHKKITDALAIIEKAEAKAHQAAKQKLKQAKRAALEAQRKQETEHLAAEKKAAQDEELAKHQRIIDSKLSALTPSKRAEYESRAASKNQSISEYITRRLEKKEAKSAAKAAKAAVGAAPDAMFFTDTQGDAALLTSGLKAAKALEPPSYTPLPDGSCPLDPLIWKNHVVKTLPKPVREARRKYLEQRRNERKVKSGKKIDHGMTRTQKKDRQVRMLMAQDLEQLGIEKGMASKEEKMAARARAKKQMKVQKKLDKEMERGSRKLAGKKKGSHIASEKAKARNRAAAAAAAAKASSVAVAA